MYYWWNCKSGTKYTTTRAALYTTRVNPYAMTNGANVQLLIARIRHVRVIFSVCQCTSVFDTLFR